MMNNNSDDLITRFLLGELSEEERVQVEKRFLSDNEFFEEVLSAEDDLMDQYILGRLSGDRRERAEALFRSSPGQRREVEFTESLMASLREAKAGGDAAPALRPAAPVNEGDAEEAPLPAPPALGHSRNPFSVIKSGLRGLFPRFAPLAVSLLCLSLLAWVIYRYSQGGGPAEQGVTAERSTSPEPRPEPSVENRNDAEPGGQVASGEEPREHEKVTPGEGKDLIARAPARKPDRVNSILLTPTALERGVSPQTPVFRFESGRVRLQLALDESWRYGQFGVLITTFDGRTIWSRTSLPASEVKRRRLTLSLPSSLFGHEDYRVELKGLSDDGDSVHLADYIFKVRN